MNSMRPAEEIEKAIKRISNTLISVAEGYTAKDLLSDISQDYDIDGHDFASQCGFSSFEEFMASDLMKKYVKVERQEDGLLYKPAYDPCMQHILDEMLKSRSDVLRKKQIKESREAAKNAKNSYTNNPPVNLFRQFGLNNNNSFASSSNALNNQPRQQDLIQQPQLKPNGPVPLMSIPVQSLCREGENYRSSQHNNFTALQPRSTAFFNPHATTYSKADNSNSQTAFLPNKQIASKPAGIPARIEQVSGQSSARDMANHNRTGQHNIKAELLVDKKSNSSSSSNDFEIYNAPPETSKAVPISSTTKKQINSINWDLDEEEEQATQQSPKNHNPNNIMRKSSSSDEWDFGELEIRKTVTKPVPVAPSRTVASSPHPPSRFFGANYHKTHDSQAKTVSTPTPISRPIVSVIQTRKTPQSETIPTRRTFQRMPDTSPPTMFSSTVSVAKTSSASAKNPTLWLGDLEKKKLEEEERLQRPQMAASRLSRTTNNQLGQSYGQPFTPAASFGAIQRNREIASHAPSATASANTNRATPALTSASRNFSNRNQPMHYSSVKTSYKGTGYKTREEYENRLELSDSE